MTKQVVDKQAKRRVKLREQLDLHLDNHHQYSENYDAREYVKACIARTIFEKDVKLHPLVENASNEYTASAEIRGKAVEIYRKANIAEAKSYSIFGQFLGVIFTLFLFVTGVFVKEYLETLSDQNLYLLSLVGCLITGLVVGWLLRHLYPWVRVKITDGVTRILASIARRKRGG